MPVVSARIGCGCLHAILYVFVSPVQPAPAIRTSQGAVRSHFSFLSRHLRQETTGRGRFRDDNASSIFSVSRLTVGILPVEITSSVKGVH